MKFLVIEVIRSEKWSYARQLNRKEKRGEKVGIFHWLFDLFQGDDQYDKYDMICFKFCVVFFWHYRGKEEESSRAWSQ